MPDPDSSILFNIILLFVLILCNAFFAMSEIAVISLNDNKMKKMAEEGNKKARAICKLTKEPSKFLATIQVGVTLSGFFASAVAADSFVDKIMPLISITFIPENTLRMIILVIITLLLSYFTLVLGELVPKRIAMNRAESLAFRIVGILTFLYKAMKPFVALLAVSTNLVLRLFGIGPDNDSEEVTEEEIRMMVDVGNEKGVIEESQKEMINNVFEFDDRTAGDVMTHRTDMIAVEMDASIQDIVYLAINKGFSRIPVYEDTLDDITGVIYVKDLLCLVGCEKSTDFHIQDFLRPVIYVPESKRCGELFIEFQQKKAHLAVVVDEYGGTSGLVTMEDLLESIVGNIQDEYDQEEEEISQIDEDTFVIDGSTDLGEVEELLGFQIDDEDELSYDTLGGLITDLLGRIPGDDEQPTVTFKNIQFSVLKVEERRILKVKAHVDRIPTPDEEDEDDEKNRERDKEKEKNAKEREKHKDKEKKEEHPQE